MQLAVIEPRFIDRAWKDGASCLAEACATVDEITGDQLKMIMARGERTLVALRNDDKTVGWGCYQIDQLPNVRVLHITALVSHNSRFEDFFGEIKKVAEYLGCSEVRCSCKPAQERLFRMKCGFEPVYTTLRVKL